MTVESPALLRSLFLQYASLFRARRSLFRARRFPVIEEQGKIE